MRQPSIKSPVSSHPYNKNASALYVRETLEKNKVVIFSKSNCPYSTIAKEQFKLLNFPFLTVELNDRRDGDQIQVILGEMTGATTVPRVFVNGNFIGGGTDIKKLYETGELQKMVHLLII